MSATIPFPVLEHYLSRLYSNTQADTRVWADGNGCAKGRYFNSTLTRETRIYSSEPANRLPSANVIAR